MVVPSIISAADTTRRRWAPHNETRLCSYYTRPLLVVVAIVMAAVLLFYGGGEQLQQHESASKQEKRAIDDPKKIEEVKEKEEDSIIMTPDPNGYLIFCLQMGRYGNQMEHLLGVMGRMKDEGNDRTIVLPPFVSYNRIPGGVEFIPVDSIFRLDKLREYYPKIVPLHAFMKTLAPTVWKKRIHYCVREPCVISGIPIKPFWNHIGIHNFMETFIYKNLNDMYNLPSSDHPVIAQSSALARYPMLAKYRHVAKYFVWKDPPVLPKDAVVVATHIRAGSDMIKACKGGGIGNSDYMASPQCHGPSDKSFVVTESICMPNRTLIVQTLKDAAQRVRKPHKRLVLYVASDTRNMAKEIMDELGSSSSGDGSGSGTYYDDLLEFPNALDDPFVDLAVLSKADYFIGNCVSSFTSFSARMRDAGTTEYFGVEWRHEYT